MSRLIIALALLVVGLLAPTSAYAETYTWSDGTPKQGERGFLLCRAEATANGLTYIEEIHVGADIDRSAAQERPNQISQCQRWYTTNGNGTYNTVVGWFKYSTDPATGKARNIDIDPSIVKVSYRFLP